MIYHHILHKLGIGGYPVRLSVSSRTITKADTQQIVLLLTPPTYRHCYAFLPHDDFGNINKRKNILTYTTRHFEVDFRKRFSFVKV